MHEITVALLEHISLDLSKGSIGHTPVLSCFHQGLCDQNANRMYSAGSGNSSAPASSQSSSNAQQSTGVKEGEPATSLQIRLADGSKLTGRFNLTQTVQDVKR